MAIIGLSGEEQNDILRMLAAILWIGNVSYNERDDGNAEIADSGTVDFVAYLLEAPPELVSKVLTTKVVETQRGGRRGSVYDVPLNPAQAAAGRDALAKALYNNMRSCQWVESLPNMKGENAGVLFFRNRNGVFLPPKVVKQGDKPDF